ncbi:hypothetical protein RJT34_11711 [Clitoria ternatea]|uniref:Cation/H+ exchanger domain-containing protein n=1 Tax=Clitoria ternatea TaxID=43366 RepID=A0AAN9PIP1_CLITE
MALVNVSTDDDSLFPRTVTNRSLWVCEHWSNTFYHAKGIFHGENPLNHRVPVFFLQTTLLVLMTTWLQVLFAPLGGTAFVPQMLAGVIAGPSVLGNIQSLRKWLFPPRTFYVTETLSYFGCSIYMFLMGVKIDPVMIMRKTGRKSWTIGVCCSLLPIIFGTLAASVLQKFLPPTQDLCKSLYTIALFLSTGSFHVTASHLADLKLLNSEVGQLALSSALVSGLVSATWVTIIVTQQQVGLAQNDAKAFDYMIMSLVVMVIIIICVLRPIMFWMIRQTPKGEPIRESFLVLVFLMLLGCILYGEIIGEHFLIGPIVFGLAVPEGPPLGSALVEKLDTMSSFLLVPTYYLLSGAQVTLNDVQVSSFIVVQLVAIVSFCAKLIGTVLPSMFFKLPLIDALSLGLILTAQGITQLFYLQTCLYLRMVDNEAYSNMMIALLWSTALATPAVKCLYDPSKRYLSLNRRRTIEHASPNEELRLMACVHCEENTTSIINLLEMSNSTPGSPICVYVLHLIQLRGRSAPVFIDHDPNNTKPNLNQTPHNDHSSQHIINAFKSYEQQNFGGDVAVKLFTSISPYETMHDEICMQAAEKRACMLITPFHRQWRSSDISRAQPIRAFNRQLLRTAPCSVGILVERGNLIVNNPLTCVSFYSVGIIFIDGPDDREALSYAMRMANHQNVRVTVIRLIEPHKKNKNSLNRDPDGDLIHKFKVECIQVKRHDYREEIVMDSLETINVVRSLEGCFDLILVGRRHSGESPLFSGLTEWNEYPELGSVGDMLVSSDSAFDGSVLVVQQQNKARVGHHDRQLDHAGSQDSRKESLTILEVPRDKVWL